jgi:hypothetical protein
MDVDYITSMMQLFGLSASLGAGITMILWFLGFGVNQAFRLLQSVTNR